MSARTMILTAAAALFAAASLTHAAVITDPTLYTTVDPTGGATVDADATNSATLATFNAQSNLKVIQDWTGHTGGASSDIRTASGQIISFTDASLPDIRIKVDDTNDINSNNPSNLDGNGTSQNTGVTADALGLRSKTGTFPKTFVIEIDFGSWDGATFTDNVNAVKSAGFTLSNFNTSDTDNVSASVAFINPSGTTLQTVTGDGALGQDLFFGYIATGSESISKVNLEMTFTADRNSMHFDDLGFTVIPEPASMALLGLGGVLIGWPARRRA